MQKADFQYEILIHDDASTDGTDDIIREYAQKYPTIIKPIFEKENQYSKGVPISATFNYPRAEGKYIALCEGDDYWTDPYKLQKQVDYLEDHPEYVMCFTGAEVITEIDNSHADLFKDLETREYTGDEIISRWIVPTCTVVYKKDVTIPVDKRFIVGDNVTFLSCAKLGKIYCLSEQAAVYRQNAGGWTATHTGYDVLCKWLDHYKALLEHFPNFEKSIKRQITKTHSKLFFKCMHNHNAAGFKFLFQGIIWGRLEFLRTSYRMAKKKWILARYSKNNR